MSTPTWHLGPARSTRRRPGRVGQIRTASAPARLRSVPSAVVPDALGTLTGYASVYSQWTEIHDRSGTFMESIGPGAFRSALADPSGIRVIYAHGHDPLIGSRPLGPLTALRSNNIGLEYEAPMFDNIAGRELLGPLRSGLLGSSFRFTVEDEQFTPNPGRSEWNPQGLPERTVLQANVMEIGPCPFPAYSGATAGMKPEGPDMLTLSGNTTGTIAASKTPRSTRRPSWQLPEPKPDRSYLLR